MRRYLRSIAPLYAVNAAVRSAHTKRRYQRWLDTYRTMPAVDNRSVPVLPDESLHILFVGTDEYQDRSGAIQALQRLARVTLFTRADGGYGQNHPDVEHRAANNSHRLEQLMDELAAAGELPQLLLMQSWSDYMEPSALAAIKARYGTVVVNIGMDDRHRWDAIRPLIPALDLALTAAPECVDWYEKEGCPALFFPEASDPEIFHPMPDLPKLYDISFVGGRYGIREKIVQALRRAGLNVMAYGHGWEAGRLPLDATPQLFAQSRIVLGVGTIGHCSDFYALKMRDFDAPMSGSLYLTHDNPDLAHLFRIGEEIVTYRSVDACVERARYYLEHEAERERIAAAGARRAAADHSWYHRFSGLLEVLGHAARSD